MLEKSISFLTILKENNYKEWFHENKHVYETAKKEFEEFVNFLIKEVHSIDDEIGYPRPIRHHIKPILERTWQKVETGKVNSGGIIFISNLAIVCLPEAFGCLNRIY